MKTHAVSSDIRRAMESRGFLAALFGTVLVILLASIQKIASETGSGNPLPFGFHAQMILNAIGSDDMALALPVLCILPYTTAYVDDIKSGFIKLHLPRCGVDSYIKGKLIACALTGGLALFGGIFIAYGLSALVFSPMELANASGQAAQTVFAEIIGKAAIIFLMGALWSLVGLTMAAATMSRYMAYASPFVLYFFLNILHERYFQQFYVLDPKEWLNPQMTWVLGDWGIALLLAVLGVVVGLQFAIIAQRRLSHG